VNNPHNEAAALPSPASTPFAVLKQAIANQGPAIHAACAALTASTARLAELMRNAPAAVTGEASPH
jgi:hypothetical protein